MFKGIEKILVDKSVRDEPLVKKVVSRMPKASVEEVGSTNDPLRELASKDLAQAFKQGKRQLMLMPYKGDWLRACPGTSQHVCCNLWTVNPGEGCPLDCTYCYLQSYLERNPTLKLYTNISDLLIAIEKKVQAEPSRYFRIGTGEVIDSLVWDSLTDSSKELVPLFARLPNAALELKTKTAEISNLLDMKDEHNDGTVVSWSMNAREVCEKDEANTASFDDRLDAARRVQEAGYRVGIHFDPVIHFSGWKEAYSKAVREVISSLDPKRLAWVSVSTLRYKPSMQRTMEERFPNSKIPFGEQFLAKDGKMRYLQALRFKLVKHVWNEIKQLNSDIPAYMCMESSQAWKTIAGGPPVKGEELREVFSRKGRLSVIQESANT